MILFFIGSIVHVFCRRVNWFANLTQKPEKFPELATLRLRLTTNNISLMVSTNAENDF